MTQIPNHPMYYATTDGTIYSNVNNAGNLRDKPYKLKLCLDRDGYQIVGIHHVTKKVHRLVATTFIPNPDNLPVVNHIDGCKTNNNVSNLEWCTHAENTQHAVATGLCNFKTGEKHYASKLSDEDTIKLIQGTLEGTSNEELADRYGLHSRYVSLVRHQKRQKAIWDKHFPGVSPVFSNKILNSKDPLVLEEIVRTAYETTYSNAAIASRFNIDASTVSRIRSNNRPTAYYKPYIEKYLK